MIDNRKIAFCEDDFNKYRYLSNEYMAGFKYAGIEYSSVEQFLIYQRMVMFKRDDVAEVVLDTDDIELIHDLGKAKIEHFDVGLWDKNSYILAKKAIKAKFSQNKELCRILLKTGNAILIYCSEKNRKWGIGLGIDDDRYHNVRNWKGQNLLGKILMEVRAEIAKEGIYEYVDAKDMQPNALWKMSAGMLNQNPKLYPIIHAYSDTLVGHDKEVFYYEKSLWQWDLVMQDENRERPGMPMAGFYEMKQEIYDYARCKSLASILS